MTIHFDLDINDWVAFQEYYKGKRAPIYKLLMPLLAISAVLLVGINIIYLSQSETSWFTTISGILLLAIFYLFFLKKKSKEHLRKVALDLKAKNPDAFGEREMLFEASGITIHTGKSSKVLPWTEVDKCEENKDYYFLYSKKGMVYIIPKSKITGDLTAMMDAGLNE